MCLLIRLPCVRGNASLTVYCKNCAVLLRERWYINKWKILYAFTYFLCRRYQVQVSYICTRLKKKCHPTNHRETRKKTNTTIISKFLSFTYYYYHKVLSWFKVVLPNGSHIIYKKKSCWQWCLSATTSYSPLVIWHIWEVTTVCSISLTIVSYHMLLRMMQVSGTGNICFYTSVLACQLSITVSFGHQVVLMQKLAFGVPNFLLVNRSFELPSS